MARRKIKKRSHQKSLLIFVVIISILTACLWWLHHKPAFISQKPLGHVRSKVQIPESRKHAREQLSPGKAFSRIEPSALHRKVAIIIDDIGNSRLSVEELIEIDAPLTFSILHFALIQPYLLRRFTGLNMKSCYTFPWNLYHTPVRIPARELCSFG
ncbi:MAG: hypothetical protein ACLQBQ_00180 [Smithella sp.]